ncbi:MAG: hypothetical protein E2594_00260 [Pseudomonas sp.]|nr:hypothetical protein [Pseudomonas sp.]
MILRALFLCFPEIDAKAKFVLLGFMLRYGEREALPASTARRAEELGLSSGDLRGGLERLVREGYLVEEVFDAHQVGRPKRIFSVSKQLVECLSGGEEAVIHCDLVRRVIKGPEVLAVRPSENQAIPKRGERLVWIDEKPVPKRGNRLSLANRLLLAVLFAHADAFGVVRRLSHTDLCRLSGIEAKSLKQRVRKLIALGYIRRHVPGCASPLFQRKLKSVYLMNLAHPQLKARVVPVLLHESQTRLDSENKYVRGLMVDVLTREKFGGGSFLTPPSILSRFLKEPLAVFSQLDFHLCCWASELLACQVGDTDGRAIVRGSIVHLLRASTLCARTEAGILGPPQSKELREHDDWEALVDYFFYQACQLADECQDRFGDFVEMPLDYRDLMLAPTALSEGNRCMALLTRKGGTQIGERCLVISETADSRRSRWYPHDADINASLLFKCGLLEKAAGESIA